jgi:hypothetical protein
MTKQHDYILDAVGVIISFGFIFGLSFGMGVKIPSEGDAVLMIYDALNQSFTTMVHGNSQFYNSFSEYGSMLHIMVFVLEIIPIICALALLPWGPVLLIDTVVAGYSLGIFVSTQNQAMMWIGLIALCLFPVFSGLILESKKRIVHLRENKKETWTK